MRSGRPRAAVGFVLGIGLLGFALGGCEQLVEDIVDHIKSHGGGSVPPPNGGGNGPSSCFGGGFGSSPQADPATTCKTAGALKQKAADICAASKATLTALDLTQPCGNDTFAGMNYSCCQPGSTPLR